MEIKSERAKDISDELFEVKKEVFEAFYKNHPEIYKQDWYNFAKELNNFQEDLMGLLLRFFLFKDVLMQIDESHPQWKSLNETLQVNYEKLMKTKILINELIDETSEATHNAIVIARSIDEDISFEEADKCERKRWE